jgi:NADH:ubiquinone oxidoreductase subunit F (NADH-binding)
MIATGTSETVKSILREVVQLDRVEYTLEMKSQLEQLSKERVVKPFILVSSGTAGMVAGAARTRQAVEEYLDERSIDAELHRTGTLGMLHAEPVVAIQLPGRARLLFRNITADKVRSLLDDVFHQTIPPEFLLGQIQEGDQLSWKNVPEIDSLPFFEKQMRIVLENCGIIDPWSIEEYIARGGYKAFLKAIRNYTYKEICELVEESGLRGRSGSGFNAGTKWKIAYHTPSDNKYLVCNAEESDPGAFMDRAIMEGNPHLLLEGMAIAAYGIGAAKAFIYIRSEYTESISRLEYAIERAHEYGLLGHDIFGSGFNLDITIRKGPGAFVCGEETALIKSLEGRRGMPKSKPPYPATSGFHKKPTVINNVETLSNVPAIIGKGPKWFRQTGLGKNPGTKILAISGRAKEPGLIEVPLGTPLSEIVHDIAGGTVEESTLKAVHIGGPSGFSIPVSESGIPLDYEELKALGISMGSGGIVLIDGKTCILDLVKYFMNFMQMQSCGKCIPCREGTRRMSEILESITRKPVDENGHATLERFKGVMQLESLAEVMKDTSLCGLGQTAANPVLSTLRWFRDEYEEHIFDRKCRSNICTELRTYFIEVEACTGCAACAKKCPEDAIFGTPLHPYFIVAEKCTGCGICFDSCKFSAIGYR